jgi:quinol-cytochrome oxidoreductase complex cytochrome b subunit
MSVDYSKQYRPDQLEPFWPNEVVKMSVAVLCTLAIIMLLAILPVVLEGVGIHVHHAEEPANPHGGTPPGIKPEWYFLAVYQHLKLMPTQLLGVDGKMLGVLSQGVGVMVVIGLPFWYRRKAHDRPGWLYRTVVTSTIFGFLGLTIWGGWPEKVVDGEEQLLPLTAYIGEQPMLFALTGVALVVFYLLIWQERRAIRRVLDGPAPRVDPNREKRS